MIEEQGDLFMVPFEEGRRVGHIVLESGCWLFTGCVNRTTGYGKIKVAGRHLGAHVAYYQRYRGPVPVGMTLDHLCRVRSCVNPWHLEVVTNQENVKRGLALKVTDDEVRAIRQDPRRHVEVAKDYGVSACFVGQIRNGIRRTDVRP